MASEKGMRGLSISSINEFAFPKRILRYKCITSFLGLVCFSASYAQLNVISGETLKVTSADGSTYDHLKVVEAAAPRNIPVMVENNLLVLRILEAARESAKSGRTVMLR